MNASSAPPQVRPASEHHLGEVVSVKDVGDSGRVSVRLYGYDGTSNQDAIVSARLCVPFAGSGRGAFLVPDVGDEVLIGFVNGDSRQAIVLGALWNGKQRPAEKLGGGGDKVDRWTFVGKTGTRIAIEEESGGAVIKLQARSGGQGDIASCVIDARGGGSITLKVGATSLKLDPQGAKIETSGTLETKASSTTMTSATVDVSSGLATFSGNVTANGMVNTPSVVATSYTPGAGNVW